MCNGSNKMGQLHEQKISRCWTHFLIGWAVSVLRFLSQVHGPVSGHNPENSCHQEGSVSEWWVEPGPQKISVDFYHSCMLFSWEKLWKWKALFSANHVSSIQFVGFVGKIPCSFLSCHVVLLGSNFSWNNSNCFLRFPTYFSTSPLFSEGHRQISLLEGDDFVSHPRADRTPVVLPPDDLKRRKSKIGK